ncbi:beta-ketoacyl-ACP synthase 3, partial [Streptomyces sp. NPDC059374]|uniref:beta-ketoacyl-ACP synthase 3 n=1 Tax=Streptomyces sp. NPDC059374 TaxID=3346814 RepID=UPI00368DE47A
MNGSRIAAVGHYQPARVLTNEDLAGMVDTSDEWITSRVGIRTRHIAGPDEPVDELAAHAAAKALASAGLAPEDIDLVLVATSTAIDRSPNMAARVAARLGIPSPAAMDINVVCAGFTHALATADHAVRAGSSTRALVIGADKMSDVTDWTDRTTCVLVGDGAGAAVVEASAEPGIGPVLWGSVPEMGHAVRIEGQPARFAQEGQSVYRWATTRLPAIARAACVRARGAPPAPPRGGGAPTPPRPNHPPTPP